MEATEAIVANSHHHTLLLNIITGLEYVPQAKKQQAAYVKDLELQVLALKENITLLAAKTKKERKEHETLRDSTSRRFAHKLIGKKQEYMAKENKEERCAKRTSLFTYSSFSPETLISREYVEALEREMTERDNEHVTQQLLDEAKAVVRCPNLYKTRFQRHSFFQLANLTDKEMEYESAQAELEALYHQIFDGPTEGEHFWTAYKPHNGLTSCETTHSFP